MKSHTLILLALLTGCSQMPQGHSGVNKPSDAQYVRDVTGRTQYRITDGNVYKPDGTRVARITKK